MTVAVPTLTEVTSPEVEIVATVVGVILHATDGLVVVLPSLFVADTVICTVLLVVPVSMVGDTGPTAMELTVGFTKNPVQLTPRAKIARTPKAMARRSGFFLDDIVV